MRTTRFPYSIKRADSFLSALAILLDFEEGCYCAWTR